MPQFQRFYIGFYQELLLDFDECVSNPLMEPSNSLSLPSHLLTTNLKNEVIIEGRSDTAALAHYLNRNEASLAPRYLL